MSTTDLLQFYTSHPNTPLFKNREQSSIAKNQGNKPEIHSLHLNGLAGSSAALFASSVISTSDRAHFIVIPDKENAAYFYNDIARICGDDSVLFFPSAYKRSIINNAIDEAGLILRTAVLNTLKHISNKNIAVVTYPEALLEKVITSESLEKNTLTLKVGEKISISFIREVLYEYHFEEVEFVNEPGQFSVRGSIVDIFSYSHHLPYRIDFFGDEAESRRMNAIAMR